MLSKINYELKFSNKRNSKIITPCCQKSNKDLKFVNFVGLPNNYGYCHACGESTLPQSLYENEKGELFKWNKTLNKLEKTVIQNCHTESHTNCMTDIKKHDLTTKVHGFDTNYGVFSENHYLSSPKSSKIIDKTVIQKSLKQPASNNFCKYLYSNFKAKRVEQVIKDYRIGTTANGFTIFWFINLLGNAQKSKAILYQNNGNRTNQIRVNFKNEQGYYFCLYGEHLLKNQSKPIILVESEKTAVICSIKLPQYNWLAYSGINGLTLDKMHVLKNREILIIPDISQKAVNVMRKKSEDFKRLNIDFQIYDLTNGKTDEELQEKEIYNKDISDLIVSP
ncbi:DUF6371 domain-containing protein [Psychroflexus sp. ALD_RP9]|uniref:DUF6371 domain-containing protein n=1 Tax=Psychroflexus sp. ALD_RP9 TaxID=2777186 RepID=UPI001A8CE5A0|nr:DUF6371 domain-containing protein [Psychroflexus sp. ALD_RP9]QSS97815.1 hypothetical protein IMZ30_03630 [Psychroflexus sp. ALD_RP9]